MTTVALRLLENYAPARPVRLLGVRVAGLSHGAPTVAAPARPQPGHPDQLLLQV